MPLRPPLGSHQIGVLVVEDEPAVRMDLLEALSAAGLQTFESSDATEAVAILAARDDIRVVIADVVMPGSPMNGYQLARLVAVRWPHIAILLVSGVSTPGHGDLPSGVRFVPKPYRSPDLVNQVFAFVEQGNGAL
ncbi:MULTISPECIES: response regulator [unclassified Methylobacterium]|jgi:CheY-like chemotaxis protein|uniref:response regulator n=1 Tax=unclassified Methylobacterium TaxID=2615210 RepID=UPI0008F255D6|nr:MULTISPECIES: response regulator [unclassified Methylobacterium]SFV13139.1 Response regulator receiver domain-containing protein [Methylobacterium sp. UNCCL125]